MAKNWKSQLKVREFCQSGKVGTLTDVTSGTWKLHCYAVKFRFTSLYSNRQLDLDLRLTGSQVPGYMYIKLHRSI